MNQPSERAVPEAAVLFGCLGVSAAVVAGSALLLLIHISSPTLTPVSVKAWNWTAVGLSILNGTLSWKIMKSSGWAKVLWVVGSSVAIVSTCPHL